MKMANVWESKEWTETIWQFPVRRNCPGGGVCVQVAVAQAEAGCLCSRTAQTFSRIDMMQYAESDVEMGALKHNSFIHAPSSWTLETVVLFIRLVEAQNVAFMVSRNDEDETPQLCVLRNNWSSWDVLFSVREENQLAVSSPQTGRRVLPDLSVARQ